jgi:hypothetical protein
MKQRVSVKRKGGGPRHTLAVRVGALELSMERLERDTSLRFKLLDERISVMSDAVKVVDDCSQMILGELRAGVTAINERLTHVGCLPKEKTNA